ncbi:SCP-like extracellular [Qipengyuania sp. YG27]|uniref:SCP-like extracellular n=2 Tax=Qipengyuania mesophila TaxID=2867246 RepID=A0ABS7JYH9_9SPHN|nr:SCP-like extracellular [Qipengyuania mesophila]
MTQSKKWIAPLAGAFALLCATGSGMAASSSSSSMASRDLPAMRSVDRRGPSDLHLAARILRAHNDERQRLSLKPLKWNVHLEREAREWAQHLSSKGMLQHADQRGRNQTGENLWMGTAGHWPVENMVGMFIDEKKHYRHARFPDISKTGNWADVGHYSQIVWRDTQEVGCAVATARGNDVLVCRYWPAGNVWGQKAY